VSRDTPHRNGLETLRIRHCQRCSGDLLAIEAAWPLTGLGAQPYQAV
jgi:hypothetical protein